MKYVIFANGKYSNPDEIIEFVRSHPNRIIAADGGARFCIENNLTPAVVIGDLDSLSSSQISLLQAKGVEIRKFPKEKDEIDLELALNYAINNNAESITIFGGLGNRWDMSIANILLLAHPDYSKHQIEIIHAQTALGVITPSKPIRLLGEKGNIFSLIPLTPIVQGINVINAKYPLINGTLHFGKSRGISNEFLNSEVTITIQHGVLLYITNYKKSKEAKI